MVALGSDVQPGNQVVRALTVFFPAFNDARSLPKLIADVFDVLRRRVPDHEVIVVNDGSIDDTANVLTQLRQQYGDRLHVITHAVNLGYGAVLRRGFEAATKDWVFYTDGDGQYDPRELDLLLDAASPDTGLVNGYKVQRQDPWHRTAIGWIYNRFARALFGIKLRDIDCDFRLIRRDLLTGIKLRSTSGTICLELVRKLEVSGCTVIEVPVSHYPRLYGRSQFFRVRSLTFTFYQLCRMFCTLVALPAILRAYKTEPPVEASKLPPAVAVIATAAALFSMALVTYGRALSLPLIADDYVQIDLAREYGPASKWSALAADALYRCRATSLIMTYWTEHFFGVNAFVLNASSLFLHFLNAFLVYLLGVWRRIGWKLSAVAAALFVVNSHPQEAVMWYAALPELLVFFFGVASFLCWLIWVQSRSRLAYVGSFVLFCVALLSKESAVAMAPLMAGALLLERQAFFKRIPAIAPFAAACIVYFLFAYQSRATHLHFNDGTFSLATPFWIVVTKSIARILWVWGILAIAILLICRGWRWAAVISIAAVWMIVTLLPYSFLTYMSRVPSLPGTLR